MSEHDQSTSASIQLRFPHSKDDLRKITVRDEYGQYDLYRMAPAVLTWPAVHVPDKVNPRSHDAECLKSPVARSIEDTLRHTPEDFWLANRGGFLLADRVKFEPDRGQVEIYLTDEDIHGMADGATTNAVIAKVQKEHRQSKDDVLGKALQTARFNLDVVVGLTDLDRIAKLVQGRNRSVQVKEWSLSDFKGAFNWLKDHIDRCGGPFRGKIGWQENAGTDLSVLDLLSLLTLFHPVYDDPAERRRRRAPTVAYSSKGTADRRLVDPDLSAGYMALLPVIEDILRLHDHVYAGFEPAYERFNKEVYNKGAKLGKRRGVECRQVVLPLTGTQSQYRVDKGLLFPLLAAHRALLRGTQAGVKWRLVPIQFFDERGPDLVGLLFEEYEKLGRNPTATGKTASVYTNLHNQARLLLAEAEEQA
jgi:hypothetical protein